MMRASPGLPCRLPRRKAHCSGVAAIAADGRAARCVADARRRGVLVHQVKERIGAGIVLSPSNSLIIVSSFAR